MASPMPRDTDRGIKKIMRLRIHFFRGDEWRFRNNLLRDKLEEAKESLSAATWQKSVDNFYNKVERHLDDTLGSDGVEVKPSP